MVALVGSIRDKMPLAPQFMGRRMALEQVAALLAGAHTYLGLSVGFWLPTPACSSRKCMGTGFHGRLCAMALCLSPVKVAQGNDKSGAACSEEVCNLTHRLQRKSLVKECHVNSHARRTRSLFTKV